MYLIVYCTLCVYWWFVPLDNDLGMSWKLLYLSLVLPSVKANLVHSVQLHSKCESSHHVLNLYQVRYVHFALHTWTACCDWFRHCGWARPCGFCCAHSVPSCPCWEQVMLVLNEKSILIMSTWVSSILNYMFMHGCKVTCFHPLLMGPGSLVCASMIHCWSIG